MKEVKKIDKEELINKYLLIFMVGCLAGWIYEEIFYLISDGHLYNRGFLYGPYLPIYGYGAVLIYFFCNRYKQKPAYVFLISFLLTGIFEYFSGFFLYKIYHIKWWDYTGLFLNLDGYICLRSLLSFALAALLLIYFAVPLIEKVIKKIGIKKVKLINKIYFSIFLLDTIITMIFRY